VIKKINIKKMSPEEKDSTYKEAKILELLSHPNIVHFREIYKNSGGEICIVMDYADGKLVLR
jgi:serine/threonine protein kinase